MGVTWGVVGSQRILCKNLVEIYASRRAIRELNGHRNKRAWVKQKALETRFDQQLGWPNKACLRGQPSLS